MPAERTVMRQVREVLRLKFVGGVPIREIARRMGVAASTVRATIRRFQAAGLSWPLPEEMTDAVLEAKPTPARSRVTVVGLSRTGQASIASSSTSAVDTGIAVNPDTIVAQLQGGLIFGLTAALWGKITIERGRVRQSNFNDIACCASMKCPRSVSSPAANQCEEGPIVAPSGRTSEAISPFGPAP